MPNRNTLLCHSCVSDESEDPSFAETLNFESGVATFLESTESNSYGNGTVEFLNPTYALHPPWIVLCYHHLTRPVNSLC